MKKNVGPPRKSWNDAPGALFIFDWIYTYMCYWLDLNVDSDIQQFSDLKEIKTDNLTMKVDFQNDGLDTPVCDLSHISLSTWCRLELGIYSIPTFFKISYYIK